MDSGISVLLGTVTGGLISFATTFYFTNKAAVATARQLEADRAVALQVSVRLVAKELNRNLLFLGAIAETRLWLSDDAFEQHQWRAHNSVLAAHLSEEYWENVSITYGMLSVFVSKDARPNKNLNESNIGSCERIIEITKLAIANFEEVLQRHRAKSD